jgi:hypothetical protein
MTILTHIRFFGLVVFREFVIHHIWSLASILPEEHIEADIIRKPVKRPTESTI